MVLGLLGGSYWGIRGIRARGFLGRRDWGIKTIRVDNET